MAAEFTSQIPIDDEEDVSSPQGPPAMFHMEDENGAMQHIPVTSYVTDAAPVRITMQQQTQEQTPSSVASPSSSNGAIFHDPLSPTEAKLHPSKVQSQQEALVLPAAAVVGSAIPPSSSSSSASPSLSSAAPSSSVASSSSPVLHAHPSHEQVVQESLDGPSGHSHNKPASLIAAEGAQTHLPNVNAVAPWVAESNGHHHTASSSSSSTTAATASAATITTATPATSSSSRTGTPVHKPHVPLPAHHGSALPPLEEKLLEANSVAAAIHQQNGTTPATAVDHPAPNHVSSSSTSSSSAAAAPAAATVVAIAIPHDAASAPPSSTLVAPLAGADGSSSSMIPEVSVAGGASSAAGHSSHLQQPRASTAGPGSSAAMDAIRVDRWGNIRSPDEASQRPSGRESPASVAAAAAAASKPLTAEEKARAAAARRKQLALDQERESKWVKMVSQWDRTMRKRSEKVKRRIRKGLPDSMRAAVWPRFTGAWELMRQQAPASSSASSSGPAGAAAKVGPGVYQRYAGMYSKEQDTIQRDIARTFPNHILFRDSDPAGDEAGVGANIANSGAGQGKAKGEDHEGKGSSGRSALYNVLKAYSLHDEQVGYCQGMGFPAGLFLMYMSEEEAFWMLHCIARGERYLLNGLWSPGFPLLFQCFYQFAALLQKHCPKLSAHLLSQDPPITPELYATHWFMTLFSYNLPFEVVLRIWDILLAEGPKIIFRLAIFFCKHLEKSIMAERDFAAILDILKNLHKDPIMQDPDAVIEGALKVAITRAELSKLADKFQAQKFHEEQAQQKRQQQARANGNGK